MFAPDTLRNLIPRIQFLDLVESPHCGPKPVFISLVNLELTKNRLSLLSKSGPPVPKCFHRSHIILIENFRDKRSDQSGKSLRRLNGGTICHFFIDPSQHGQPGAVLLIVFETIVEVRNQKFQKTFPQAPMSGCPELSHCLQQAVHTSRKTAKMSRTHEQ